MDRLSDLQDPQTLIQGIYLVNPYSRIRGMEQHQGCSFSPRSSGQKSCFRPTRQNCHSAFPGSSAQGPFPAASGLSLRLRNPKGSFRRGSCMMLSGASQTIAAYNRYSYRCTLPCKKDRKRISGKIKKTSNCEQKQNPADVDSAGSLVEVPSRFELENKGFADLRLTTWLWHRKKMER